MTQNFIKGLELNQGYYYDIVKPLLEKYFPELEYSAGLIGYGSDVLGYDTPVSMDHNWGPRLNIFLNEENLVKKKKINELLRKKLPYEYKGFPTNFTDPRTDNTQRMDKINKGEVNHLIQIFSVGEFLHQIIGIGSIDKISLIDWLKIPEQGLVEITSGEVFYDGLNKLNKVRDFFQFYPEDIFKIKLAGLWNSISQEEAFIGRNIDLGEEIGVRLISSRIVNYLIKICFYLEKTYPLYSKWFTKAFKDLNCYSHFKQLFKDILTTKNTESLDELLAQAYKKILIWQNKLDLTPEINLEVTDYYGRPYKVIFAEKIYNYLLESINNKKLKKVDINHVSLIHNQDGIDLTENREILNRIF
ncbi:MAG: DUF4037 domain-containing protein [Bacillota bacterium]